MSRTIAPSLLPLLEHHLGGPILETTALGGGDINDVYRLCTGRGDFVLKVSRRTLPHLLFREAQGLALLRGAEKIPVPQVVAYGAGAGGWQYLLQDYLPPAAETPQGQEALGRGLAALHSVTVPGFGGQRTITSGRCRSSIHRPRAPPTSSGTPGWPHNCGWLRNTCRRPTWRISGRCGWACRG